MTLPEENALMTSLLRYASSRRLLAVAAVAAALLTAPVRVSAQSFDLMETTVADVHAALRSGSLTCRALVSAYLDRIEAYDQVGPTLNSVQTINPEALREADVLDELQTDGDWAGPLHCVPVLLKDQVETVGMPTTFGSALFEGWVSDRDATIVTRLRDAGAIILAKTNMGEFASRYVGSAFGIIRNPYDTDRNPSGSSGGTAVAVAANFGLVGIGEDTSGSVRGPAAVTSLVGLRPTLELVSTYGMMPANPTQDTMGPMTRSVLDAARVLDAIAGWDPNDPPTAESVGRVPSSYVEVVERSAGVPRRVGVVRQSMSASTDTTDADFVEVRSVLDRAIARLPGLGIEVVEDVDIPDLDVLRGLGNSFETEAATDGYLAELNDPPVSSFREILLSGVVNPWRAHSMWSLAGKSVADPGYLEVISKRERVRVAVLAVMAELELDALVYATFDHQPTRIAPDVESNPRPQDGYGWGDNRGLSPAIGFPALSVPAGFTSDDLPVGLEFLGRPYTEGELLEMGHRFEQATRLRRPPASTPRLSGRCHAHADAGGPLRFCRGALGGLLRTGSAGPHGAACGRRTLPRACLRPAVQRRGRAGLSRRPGQGPDPRHPGRRYLAW
jgi:Asp-tRNA(Asn)/Glu-tRNA(Gln) amidotransferase A subunit family amidase